MLKQLENILGGGRVKEKVILAPYTTFKLGGPAEYYFEAETDQDIISAVRASHELNLAFTILGGVSNVIISQSGIKGLVVRNRVMYKETLEQDVDSALIKVSSGYSMTRLAKETAEMGLEGLEYHVGLPGTVGGAIYMNSKWYSDPRGRRVAVYVGDPLFEARIVDKTGADRTVNRDYFEFSYDHSRLQETGEILIWATFRLKKIDPEITKQRYRESLEYRHETQPIGIPSSGCFFRNVAGESVGKIIDELGLKGYRVGGASVSSVHANFIVNDGTATAEDVQKLLDHIKSVVREKRGIELKEEVVMI